MRALAPHLAPPSRCHPRRPRARATAGGSPPEEEDDLVTRMVGFLFGKNTVEDQAPAGLKRMNKEEWPDQWPAVVEELSASVEGDEGETALLRRLLKQTCLEKQPLALAYDADRDGWSPEAFHARLDGMGAAVLLMETRGGALCGGYNPKGWLGYGDWRDAISAFLFTWPDGQTSRPAVKLPKVGGSGMAIIDEQNGSPQFGPSGLKLSLLGRTARSKLGSYYAVRPDGSKSLFGAGEDSVAALTAVRVYVGVGEMPGAADYKPSALQWQPGELERLREQDARDAQGR